MKDSCKNVRDMQWVEEIRTGNQTAYTELYEAYYHPLCDYAFRFVKDAELMEDVVQDVFVWIWENRECWNTKPGVTVRAYLFRAIHNRIVMKIRKKRFETSIEDYNQNIIEFSHITSLDDFQNREFWKEIKVVLEHLPERRREIIVLSLMQGLTYKEIAHILDISVNTVHTQMKRALKHLRHGLKSYLPCHYHEKAV